MICSLDGDSDAVAWLWERTHAGAATMAAESRDEGTALHPMADACVARRRNGAIVWASAVYDIDHEAGVGWVASAGRATREAIRESHDFFFEHLALQMVLSFVRPENRGWIDAIKRIGYSEIRVPDLFGEGVDGFLVQINRAAWRESRFRRAPQ